MNSFIFKICLLYNKDDIPPIIWKMGQNAGHLYKEILLSGVEKRHVIRIMIVGPFGVGKTCLMRRLLKKDLKGVTSTDGINIMIMRCKVRLKDGTWMFSEGMAYCYYYKRIHFLCFQKVRHMGQT